MSKCILSLKNKLGIIRLKGVCINLNLELESLDMSTLKVDVRATDQSIKFILASFNEFIETEVLAQFIDCNRGLLFNTALIVGYYNNVIEISEIKR